MKRILIAACLTWISACNCGSEAGPLAPLEESARLVDLTGSGDAGKYWAVICWKEHEEACIGTFTYECRYTPRFPHILIWENKWMGHDLVRCHSAFDDVKLDQDAWNRAVDAGLIAIDGGIP